LLTSVVAELGAGVVAEVVDVTVEADVERLCTRAVSEFGGLDLAVNSAGLGTLAPVDEHPLEEWNTVIGICLTGTFLSVKHEAIVMEATGRGGAIVNLASINAKVPAKGMSAYCSAKAGVEMLTRCAAMELGPKGIRVAALGPGVVETPLTEFARLFPAVGEAYLESIPMGRVGQPGDIADAALFLVSDEASWVSGETLYVDGAESTSGYPDIGKIAAGAG
jgi:3-oxoacyl-[acyl-carrier protein] reductase